MICSCGAPVKFTQATVNGPAVFDDCYLLLVTCEHCQSTRAAVLWEAEEVALENAADDSEQEPLAAE